MKEKVFKKDTYRFYGGSGPSFMQRLFPPLELTFIKRFRAVQCHPKSLFWKWLLRKTSKKTQIQIPSMVRIGPGLRILHFGRIIINHHVQMGMNVTLNPGVLIGQEERGSRCGNPTIGNNVWIGTNAVIVGEVNIGNDVLIAPNAFVNFNVPSHSVVIGNPGRIIYKENATLGYTKNPI